MKQRKRSNNRIIGSILLYLLVVVIFVIPPTFSSYVSTVSGGDTVSVALVNVTTPQSGTMTVDGKTVGTHTYHFDIVSTSEVALTYDINVTLQHVLQAGMTLQLKSGDRTVGYTFDSATRTYSFKNAGTFTAQGGTHSYQLIFTVAPNTPYYDQANNVTLSLNATQID